jgi:hypothetical protein
MGQEKQLQRAVVRSQLVRRWGVLGVVPAFNFVTGGATWAGSEG